MHAPEPVVDAVVLTMGDRRKALDAAVGSIQRQDDSPSCRIVVVWNGVPATPVDADSIESRENLGVTGGRNLGAEHGDAPFLLFLDDDAELVSKRLLADAVDMFAADEQLGAITVRIVDDQGRTSPRHVPRLGGGSAARSGAVTAFLGGAVLIRRQAFDEAGRFGKALFYSMEETDLSWRLHDAGWTIHYAAELLVQHPRVEPSRHPSARELTARNRVWIARRNLPWPLPAIYVLVWTLLGLARCLKSRQWPSGMGRGTVAGLRSMPFERRPISWRTVARLTRLGRPPVI